MCEKAPISMGSNICDNCRKKLGKMTVEEHVASDSDHEVDVDSSDPSEVYVDSAQAISSLNQCLAEIGETPFLKHKAHQCHTIQNRRSRRLLIL